jgi:hypothetical protein
VAEGHKDAALLEELRGASNTVRDYFCYLLLDLVAADPELEVEPLRAAFALTSQLGWDERLESLIVKELKLKKREVQRFRAEARAVSETKAVGVTASPHSAAAAAVSESSDDSFDANTAEPTSDE